MKTWFSEGKLMKQFGNIRFQLTPYLWVIFSWTPHCPNFKNKKTRLILRGGEETMEVKMVSETMLSIPEGTWTAR